MLINRYVRINIYIDISFGGPFQIWTHFRILSLYILYIVIIIIVCLYEKVYRSVKCPQNTFGLALRKGVGKAFADWINSS